MSKSKNESYVSIGLFGKASAEYFRTQQDEQIVVVRFGQVSVHLPYSQAVALSADLDEALSKFEPDTPKAVA